MGIARRGRYFVVGLAVVVLAAGVIPVSIVRSDVNDSQLIWNSNEAYLIAAVSRAGWKGTYLRRAADVLLVLLTVPTPADDATGAGAVIKVTPADIQSFPIAVDVPFFTVADGAIRAGYTLRWAQDHFEHVSFEEQTAALVGASLNDDFSNVNGWSRRRVLPTLLGTQRRFEIQIGSQPIAFIVQYDSLSHASVSIERANHAPQQIWALDEPPHRVSAAEYRRLFDRGGVQTR
jgi:hypothetical protein